ncbi:MAG: phage tail length tape measure family protein [Anaerolineaceae bacterium]|nr:phage tail length tape measure family protein [Anaerolineaceae bacterium]
MTDYKISIIVDGKDLASGPLRGVGNAIDGVGRLAGGILAGGLAIGAAALGGFTAFMIDCTKSALAEQQVQETTNAVLKSTGGIAGVTSSMVQGLAEKFAGLTKYNVATTTSAENMLLTFTNIGKDVFPQATEAVLNLAQKFGSTEGAAVQIGKALNDPIRGVTALRRVGVMLNDTQEKQIKAFMKTGDVASAQKIILGELGTEFGGLAQAMGNTTEGKMQIFQNKLDMLKDKIGGKILPVLSKFEDVALAAFNNPMVMAGIDWFVNNLGDLGSTIINDLGSVDLSGMFAGIGAGISDAMAAFKTGGLSGGITALLGLTPDQKTLLDSFILAIQNLGGAFISSLPMLQSYARDMWSFLTQTTSTGGPQLITSITGIINQIATIWREHGAQIMAVLNLVWRLAVVTVSSALVLVTGIIQGALTLIDGIVNFFSLALQGKWGQAFDTLYVAATTAFGQVDAALLAFLSMALSVVGMKMNTFLTVWGNDFQMAGTIISKFVTNAITAISGKVSEFVTMGGNLIKGLIAGVKAFGQNLVDSVLGPINDAIAAAKKLLGIKSPSKVFAGIGQNVMLGMAQGIQAAMTAPKLALATSINGLYGVRGTSAYDNRNYGDYRTMVYGNQFVVAPGSSNQKDMLRTTK